MAKYYRMEVLAKGKWVGYYNGLLNWSGLDLDPLEYESVRCSLTPPPWDVRFAEDNAGFKCWATESGWRLMADDVLDAMILAEKHNVPYRLLACDEPPSPNMAWCDDGQFLFLPPFRRIRKGEIEVP